MFGKKKIWRINIGAGQIKSRKCEGADDYALRFLASRHSDVEIEPEAGDYLEALAPKKGDRFIVTGVAAVGGKGPAGVQHLAVAIGIVDSYEYSPVTKNATVITKKLELIEREPHQRVMPNPGVRGNVHEIDDSEWKRFS